MQLSPYLTFDGNCEEAMNFYAEALGGKLENLNYFEGSPMEVSADLNKKVMHVELHAGKVYFMASDSVLEHGGPVIKGTNVTMSLNFDSVEEEKKIFDKLAKGGNVSMPLEDTFWGAHFGMLTDKFGIHWMFNCQLDK